MSVSRVTEMQTGSVTRVVVVLCSLQRLADVKKAPTTRHRHEYVGNSFSQENLLYWILGVHVHSNV